MGAPCGGHCVYGDGGPSDATTKEAGDSSGGSSVGGDSGTLSEVVIAGGASTTSFSVIDFTNPTNPSAVNVNPGFGALGTVVDCNNATAVIGKTNGGQIAFYDVSNPSNPIALGSGLQTGLDGIGAIKYAGSYVLIGELVAAASQGSSRVVLVDATNPSAPQIISTLATDIGGISSVSLAMTHAVAAGPNNGTIDIIDYTNPTQPTRSSFNPNIGLGLSADLDGKLATVGSQSATAQVAVVDVTVLAVIGTAVTPLGGVNSVSIKGSLVAAGGNNSVSMMLLDFTIPSNPTASMPINSVSGGGWTVALNGSETHLAAGNLNGSNVALLGIDDASSITTTVLGSVPNAIASISTLGFCDFSVVSAGGTDGGPGRSPGSTGPGGGGNDASSDATMEGGSASGGPKGGGPGGGSDCEGSGLIVCTASVPGNPDETGDANPLLGTSCVDPMTDQNNCGRCGNICKADDKCSNGMCVPRDAGAGGADGGGMTDDAGSAGGDDGGTDDSGGAGGDSSENECPVGQTDCSGTCTVDHTDPGNCGPCNLVCSGGSCVGATCECPADEIYCPGHGCATSAPVSCCGMLNVSACVCLGPC